MAMALEDRKVLTLLVAAFSLVILLMLASGKLGLDALQQLGQDSTGLLSEERNHARALSQAQELETQFDQLYYAVAGPPEPLSDVSVEDQVTSLLAAVETIGREGMASAAEAEVEGWRNFQAAGQTFATEIREARGGRPGETDNLALARRRVLATVHRLAEDNDRRNEEIVVRDREAFSKAVSVSVRLLGITGGLAVIVAGSTVFLVYRLLHQLAWQRAELARLSSNILHTQEATLRRVARDLHDHVGQALTAIEANLGALDAGRLDWSVKGRIEDCLGLVKDVMSETRTLSQLLRPSLLDDFGLDASLESLTAGFSQRTGIEVSYHSDVKARLHEQAETHLFRIAQEALTNVARHAKATRVEVTLKAARNRVELIVEDDGRGLAATAPLEAGLGLRSMRARAHDIGGDMDLHDRAGGGLRVLVTVPIRQHLPHDVENPAPAG